MASTDMGHAERGAYISLGMILGVAAGAVAGLLLAPQSGTESRAALKRKQQQLRDKAMTEMENKRQMAADKLSKVSEKTQRFANKARDNSDDNDTTIL